jgi:hypothetical protein
MKKVFICSPVRNREWILNRFISHLKEMYVDDNIIIEYCFLINDCEDNSEKILLDNGFRVIKYDNLHSTTESHLRGKYSYSHLANLRNILVEEFIKSDCDYFFSVDSDILVPKNGLTKLIDNNRDICSMILCNQPGKIGKRAHNIMNYDVKDSKYKHILSWEKDSIIEVDLTGAVYLVKRSVLEDGVRYGFDPIGEDAIFCKQAKIKGYKLFCDTSLKPIHVMSKSDELIGDC